MRSTNDIMNDLIEVSYEYESVVKEIRCKCCEMKECQCCIKDLERKRDRLSERIGVLHAELQEAKEKGGD